MGTSKGKGKFITVCTYTHVMSNCSLKLLSATVGTFVIDSVDKEALDNRVG